MNQDDKIQKLNKSLENSQKSLKERMGDLKSKIERFQKFKNQTILCDVSGSMDAVVEDTNDGKVRAIDVVNDVIQNFRGCNLWEFSSRNRVNKVETLSRPNGSTQMDAAFDVMKGQRIKELILITDGQPDDEDAALDSARGLKINIIYIGPSPTPPFLKKLAKVTHGNFVDVELMKLGAGESIKELEKKITLFLTNGSI